MAVEKRISELTPKGANLAVTDLFEVSVPDGLGGFDTFYITGAEIIASGGGVNIYSADGTLDANRLVDLDTFTLYFKNGLGNIFMMYTDRTAELAKELGVNGVSATAGYGVNSNGSIAGLRGEGYYGVVGSGTASGIYASSFNGLGGDFLSTNSIALRANSASNPAFNGNGSGYFEEYGLGSSMSASALFQLNSTSRGFLPPRMTTAQISAIVSPNEGLTVYNTDRDRIETYDSSRTRWVGSAIAYSVMALTSSPTDGATIYFGNLPKAPTTTANTSKVHIKANGVITIANIYCYSDTAGTAENWSLYIRVNNTTDYLIETIGTAANERIFNNETLNISVSAGDYIEIKAINPTWATEPLTTIFGGNIIVE